MYLLTTLAHPDLTGHFHPVLRSSRLGRGPARVELGGRGYVLFRDKQCRPRALLDRCAHRFAPLSLGRVADDGTLQCRYHGWRFDGDGEGRCPSQPSLKSCTVPSFDVHERFGWLWLGAPGLDARGLPDLEADGFRFAGSLAVEAEAPLHVVLDNFNEDEHTPFIHGRLGWTEDDAANIDFETATHDDRIEVCYAARQRPTVVLPVIGVRKGDTFHNTWVVRFSPVHIVYTLDWSDPASGAPRPLALRFAIFFVPLDDRRTRIVSFVWSRWRADSPGALRSVLRAAAARAVDGVVWATAYKEIFDDARWVRHLGDTPYEHRGMRLDRYDGPLTASRRLLDRIYFGRQPRPASAPEASAP